MKKSYAIVLVKDDHIIQIRTITAAKENVAFHAKKLMESNLSWFDSVVVIPTIDHIKDLKKTLEDQKQNFEEPDTDNYDR
jgi:hypothetical protein